MFKRDSSSEHGHTHGPTDPSIITTDRGIWAVKWSFIGLMITALFQVAIVAISGSVALLADTIHNFGDASTAIPLWIAFRFARLRPTKRFPYGYGRVEDLAGIAILFIILVSVIGAAYQSIQRFLDPQPVFYLGAVAAAAIIGFVGNELVAVFRIRVGKEIHSAALIADGYHARIDGLTSLAVLGGVVGIWLGYPLADPIIGLLIILLILRILTSSAKTVIMRLIGSVDPEIIEEIEHAALHVRGIEDVSEVRMRWVGHLLHGELNLAVSPDLLISEAHELAQMARHEILHHLPYLANIVIHVDPANASGERFHRIESHAHGDHEAHFHP